LFSILFFKTCVVIALAVILIQWLFVGYLFHKFQALTPNTWRRESNRSYTASSLLSLFFAFMFTLFFSLWKEKNGAMNSMNGIEFGILCWLTFSIPVEIGNLIYINYSRLFVLGKSLSSLVEYSVAGIIAANML
jgi:hypothetical protein